MDVSTWDTAGLAVIPSFPQQVAEPVTFSVVGLDLSLTSTGMALPGAAELYGTLKPKLRGVERLAWIRDQVLTTVGKYASPFVCVEGYAFARTNQAHQLGELGGVVRLALYEAGIPFQDVAPAARCKFATGKGNANKDAVLIAAVQSGANVRGNDEADAYWLRQIGLALKGQNVTPLTKYQQEVIKQIQTKG